MNFKMTVVLAAICLFVIAFWLGGAATAQNNSDHSGAESNHAGEVGGKVGRFQISSFATEKSGTGVGYYVIDSSTGEIWMGYGSNDPGRVSDPLR